MVRSQLARLMLLPAACLGTLVMLVAPWVTLRKGGASPYEVFGNLYVSNAAEGGRGFVAAWGHDRFDGFVHIGDVRASTTIMLLILALCVAWLALEWVALLRGDHRFARVRLALAPTTALGAVIGGVTTKNAIAEGMSLITGLGPGSLMDNLAAGGIAMLVTTPIFIALAVISVRQSLPTALARLRAVGEEQSTA